MRVIRREFYNVSRSDIYHITPLGDVHLGSVACDEALLQATVDRIASDPMGYWIGMGDMAEFINVSDKRMDFGVLASWIDVADLVDIAAAQEQRFLSFVRPIAGKCLAFLEGNHCQQIKRRYERDVYSEMVTTLKAWGGMEADATLGLGIYGWLILPFYFGDVRREGVRTVTLNLHHGWAASRAAGGKALNMERWLWTHDADLVLMGHSHNRDIVTAQVESVDRGGHVHHDLRRGAYTGTFLRTVNDGGPSTYSEAKGYIPQGTGTIEITLHPLAHDRLDVVRLVV